MTFMMAKLVEQMTVADCDRRIAELCAKQRAKLVELKEHQAARGADTSKIDTLIAMIDRGEDIGDYLLASKH